jgi:hypothetical protein
MEDLMSFVAKAVLIDGADGVKLRLSQSFFKNSKIEIMDVRVCVIAF